MFVGIDDTDSSVALCTTYVLTEAIRELRFLDVIGYPKLVRFNPNIPWKTRGNAALAVRLGHGLGKPRKIGIIDGKPILSYPRGREASEEEYANAFGVLIDLVERYGQVHEENTNPGIIISKDRPPKNLYWRAVRTVLEIEEVKKILKNLGAKYQGYKNGRGLIGASGAISWVPQDRTYELIAYRKKERWGTQRAVERSSVKAMDANFPSTFNNYDYARDIHIIAPHGGCPILFGIRGDVPEELEDAMNAVVSEERDRWLIYESNQGTDDHISKMRISALRPYMSARVSGDVVREPCTIRGGHVIFRIADGKSEIDCAAYEPTKGFRDIVRQLKKGDNIEVMGGVREEPFTINIEKMRVVSLANIVEKVTNPLCEKCGKRMQSLGLGAGFRCKLCGAKRPRSDAEYRTVERTLACGWYEVPVSARRHLSKPLKRGAPG